MSEVEQKKDNRKDFTRVRRQIKAGKTFNVVKETKKRLKNDNLSEEDRKYYKRVFDLLMSYGVNDFGPGFAKAVDKED